MRTAYRVATILAVALVGIAVAVLVVAAAAGVR